jgi:hypothetical protein
MNPVWNLAASSPIEWVTWRDVARAAWRLAKEATKQTGQLIDLEAGFVLGP